MTLVARASRRAASTVVSTSQPSPEPAATAGSGSRIREAADAPKEMFRECLRRQGKPRIKITANLTRKVFRKFEDALSFLKLARGAPSATGDI